MLAFHAQIKAVHLFAVFASVALFALRGGAALAAQRWAMALPLRWLSWAIDTVLLTAALMLLTALQLNPFVVPWLATKLVLLVAYVGFATLALRQARDRRLQGLFYGAALLCAGAIYSIARAHHPLGLLRGFAT